MGFYIRKSFRAGPIRLNLSKSGLGASLGAKGARIGISGSGRSYVHGGRYGLYYRENLTSGKKKRKSNASTGMGLGVIILLVIALAVIINAIKWIVENPIILAVIFILLIVLLFVYYYIKTQKLKAFNSYKLQLEKSFILNCSPPNKDLISQIRQLKSKLSQDKKFVTKVKQVERDVYSAILDKILDDKQITADESLSIKQFESISALDQNFITETKKEIFKLYYLDIIADHEVTNDEFKVITNLIDELSLPQSEIEEELRVVQEILRMQKLRLPLEAIQGVSVKLQKNETAYYHGKGKILSRKKAKKNSDKEYEYSIQREGDFVITDKRIMVVGNGTSKVDLKNILDIDADLDNSMIVISKDTSSTPTLIQTKEPLYAAKIIDLLT